MVSFRDCLMAEKNFTITCELVPGRGYKGVSIENILQFVQEANGSESICTVSLTDNAGGNPALLADVLGPEIIALGKDPIVHISCKDLNRNSFESRAYALKGLGINNLLVVTGDYPISGFLGLPKPVFDIDSVMALHYLDKMNSGLEIQSGRKKTVLEPTDFFLGACASPFKPTEASAVMQYYKLQKKIRAGAHFIISQLGYDSRKYAEYIDYVRNILKLEVAILGSVYILSSGAARYMHSGEVPGCYVSSRLVEIIKEEARAEDKGKAARLERAARQIAVLKGLGYNGAHIEGLNLKFTDVNVVVERSKEIEKNWKDYLEEFDFSPQNQFFMFQGGESFQKLLQRNGIEKDWCLVSTHRKPIISLIFWTMLIFHKMFFVENTLGYRLMRGLSKLAEKWGLLYALINYNERFAKKVLFDCRRCDDCVLFELFYICPESQCPKAQRIGPCGGSRMNGRCEVLEDKYCIWERIYWRAKQLKKLDKLSFIIPPRNWKLYETSSWTNYFLKYDHSGTTLEIPQISERQ